ncbi:hypothetical protein BURKHO8Y_420007 [Burkholderia sp. 8Y]|uniref:hypothetical protein n=1 Tax=Burkholderia sp. 8Y TaxID=2653133 RepID=UPI0012F307C5|nr:hypothetical protein [Burkholderia sp. 8Y]VXC81220.1 hypothetical protein BURKHO8Y_420007 [Burkholderia sp. 8Y]
MQRLFDTAGSLSALVAAVAADLSSLMGSVCLDETPLASGIGMRPHELREATLRQDGTRGGAYPAARDRA